MKNFKLKTKFVLVALTLTLFMTSCTKEAIKEVQPEDQIPTAHVEQLQAMNFNTENIKIMEVELPDGTTEKSYLLEGDLALPVAQIENFLQNEIVKIPDSEQRRVSNLVTAPSVIKVLGYTGGTYALTSKMRTALSWAVNNYNTLGLTLSFSLSFGGSSAIAGADIVVYKINGAAGGSAGYPSGGNPYKWVRINSGSDAFSTNFVEGVMTHEIGHCVGMAHTDGTTGILIPGTPALDPLSIYNTTFSAGTNGELSFWDRIALNIIY